MTDPTQICPIVVEQIFPKASELSEILNYNPCPVLGCPDVFNNPPNLEMHLKKVHGIEDEKSHTIKQKNVLRQYYCPAEGCKYNPDSCALEHRYFSQHKYLKQHYIKVHMEKKFVCEQCGKGFATAQQRKRHHLDECGLKFVCSCSAEYNTVSALLTHASRKNHTFVKSWSQQKNKKSEQNQPFTNTKKPIATMPVILPKPSSTTVSNVSDSSSVVKYIDKEIQTEPAHNRRRRNTLKQPDTSRQTQTGDKRQKISSETQTVGEFSLDMKQKTKGKLNRRRKKSMETQTCTKNKGSESNNNNVLFNNNSVLDINNLSLDADVLWWNCDNSTQTSSAELQKTDNIQNYFSLFSAEPHYDFTSVKDVSLFSLSKENAFAEGKSCSTETQTECNFDVLLNNTETLSDIETQTSFNFFDQYNNMCTQTCDDILFSDLGFSDIETQTAWPDFDISFTDTETQTTQNFQLANNFNI